jgi:hypothetical protein
MIRADHGPRWLVLLVAAAVCLRCVAVGGQHVQPEGDAPVAAEVARQAAMVRWLGSPGAAEALALACWHQPLGVCWEELSVGPAQPEPATAASGREWALADLLGGLSEAEFFAEHWQRRPLHARGAGGAGMEKVRALLSLPALEELLHSPGFAARLASQPPEYWSGPRPRPAAPSRGARPGARRGGRDTVERLCGWDGCIPPMWETMVPPRPECAPSPTRQQPTVVSLSPEPPSRCPRWRCTRRASTR